MNNGAFGENFPYSNFHDLNMDWIIKIAKDFLDQYTHIQQVIEEGETSLENLTTEGLQTLADKAEEIEGLLNQWYETHSTDIANALADALNDLNDAKTSAIASFNTQAEQKAQEVIASIPSDYTALATNAIQSKGEIPVVNGAVASPLNDLDTYPINSFYISYDATSAMVAHCPVDQLIGHFSVLTMEADPSNPYSKVQFFFADNNHTYIRRQFGTWNEWKQLAEESEITALWTELIPIRNYFNSDSIIRCMGEIPVSGGAVASPLNDLNTYPVNTIYVAYDDATSSLISNCPVNAPQGRFTVITIEANTKSPYTKVQFFISFEQKIFYRRMWGSWNSWHEIAENNNLLFRAMGEIPVVNDAVASPLNDLNNYPLNSLYVSYNATSSMVAHCPITEASGHFSVLTIEAIPGSPYTSLQFFFATDQSIYYRREYGSWGSWHKLLDERFNPNNEYWKTKSIVWLGTSIPAGGRGPQGTTNNGSYPFKTREVLGNDVQIINNAVGSSCLWVLKKSLIDADTNPYGFDFNYTWERCERCIGLSIAEKQWMINHKSNWADAPAVITSEDEQRILGYSYENLVDPYIDKERLWIFDFTNNEDSADEFGTYQQSEPFARYSTKGTLQFLWNRILSAYPKSSIFVLGNYYTDWQVHGRQNTFFKELASTWTLPWFPVWEHIPASPEVPITTKGGWVNGIWDNNAYPNGHTLTLKQIFCADGLHPHSDLSGKANVMLGRIIGSWINEQGVWFT